MTSDPSWMRLCPTRTDGEPALIAHVINEAECQKRQREHFHKCPTCAHCNERDFSARPAATVIPLPAPPAKAIAG